MDQTEEDMKTVGFFGIFKQSFKSIFSRKKLFAQITLAFILPLAIIYLVQMQIAHHFFRPIQNNALPFVASYARQATTMEWLYYALFSIAYIILLTVFSLLATATVVFTIASIYTGRDVMFRDVIKIIPKVWKRLLITFAFIYIGLVIYEIIVSIFMAIFGAIFGFSSLSLLIMNIILIIFELGFLYLSVVCQLASVVTVLENVYGFSALKKGKYLASGKKAVGMGIAFVLLGFLTVLNVVYLLFVEVGHWVSYLALTWRLVIGLSCGIMLLMLLLLVIVTQTVLYLVCKSYHREAIDKLSLSMVYPGSGEEVELGRTQHPAEQV